MEKHKTRVELIKEIIPYIDYANISSYKVNQRDIKLLYLEAERYGINTIVVNPSYLSYTLNVTNNSNVKVAAVAAYPFGAYPPRIKKKEIEELVRMGADEIYMLMAVGSFLDGNYEQINEEMRVLGTAANGRPTKLILEITALNDQEIKLACSMAIKNKIDYLVTATGFAPNELPGITVEEIKKIKRVVNDSIGIIVSGDIDSLKQIGDMLKAGASRILIEQFSAVAKELNI